jgi:uncharacterized cupredoxin-like copper-binding protein
MRISRRGTLALFAGLAAFAGLPARAQGTVVKVSLWDKGPDSMDPLGTAPPMGMAMPGADSAKATMGVTADPASAPAGEITFEVVNDSKDTVHEMIVAPVKDPSTPLPYDKETQRVDEEAAGHLGEVSELDPGKSGALRLSLEPGKYILYCNIPGHYVLGMWTLFEVTPA